MIARGAVGVLIAIVVAAGILLSVSGSGNGKSPAGGSATDAWLPLKPGPLERTEVGAARVGIYVYVVGGFSPPDGR